MMKCSLAVDLAGHPGWPHRDGDRLAAFAD
jgi:hypothetical protein